jgi:hypothetical protein
MPIFPFIAGLAAGIAVVRLYKHERVLPELEKAGRALRETATATQGKLRKAAVSGLNALETSSARLREKLDAPATTPVPEAESGTPPKAADEHKAQPDPGAQA